MRGAIFYDLHNYFREQSKEVLDLFQNVATKDYLDKLAVAGANSAVKRFDEKAIFLFDCAIKLHDLLMYKAQRVMIPAQSYGLFLDKAICLQRLGRLNESLIVYEKIISFLTSALEKIFDFDFLYLLISTKVNKGELLRILGRLLEAEEEFKKLINNLKFVVRPETDGQATFLLSASYLNLGMVYLDLHLKDLDKKILDNSLSAFSNGINTIKGLKKVFISNHILMVLADCHKGKAIVIDRQAIQTGELSKATEAIKEYDEALSILNRIKEIDSDEELIHQKTHLLINKSISYELLAQYKDSLDCSGESIKLLMSSVKKGLIGNLPDILRILFNRIIVF